jgi:hypothetical protein
MNKVAANERSYFQKVKETGKETGKLELFTAYMMA